MNLLNFSDCVSRLKKQKWKKCRVIPLQTDPIIITIANVRVLQPKEIPRIDTVYQLIFRHTENRNNEPFQLRTGFRCTKILSHHRPDRDCATVYEWREDNVHVASLTGLLRSRLLFVTHLSPVIAVALPFPQAGLGWIRYTVTQKLLSNVQRSNTSVQPSRPRAISWPGQERKRRQCRIWA